MKTPTYRINSFEEYKEKYAQSVENPEAFWEGVAQEFTWKKKWSRALNWNFTEPSIKWFEGATLNITENCLDRHLEHDADTPAIVWEANDPNEAGKILTYRELHAEVCKTANILKSKGIQKGDRVCIYMPMVPELAIATLACARIGAPHSVVFAGFSAQSLSDRINDSSCKAVLTSDGLFRGGKVVELKEIVDTALETCSSVETVLVLQRTNSEVTMKAGRDCWWHEEIAKVSADCSAEEMDAEDTLFILYTSGSTGKPKGVVHTCGGYMVYAAYSYMNVFQYDPGDIYWCTADVGWITGHTYIVYGPLLNGATTVMFEGVPTYPDAGRFWEICDKLKVNQFYTAPTAIRALIAAGNEYVEKHSLSSLKVIGSVGEPINAEAWHWYDKYVGKHNCPIVDTWWQTETGGIMISALGQHGPTKPTHAGYPLPGIQPVLLDTDGNEIEGNGKEGYLAIKFPWPSTLRTTYGDHERCRTTYFGVYDGYYFTGDGARRDEDGMYRIVGRVDDVINVSGHRFGTAEIENAINQQEDVTESAVIGYPHDIKGQGIYAFVIAPHTSLSDDELRAKITEVVVREIGPIAKPDKIQVVSGLPKTRSGKIMRRILRKVGEGETDKLGDTSTLLDPSIVTEIIEGKL